MKKTLSCLALLACMAVAAFPAAAADLMPAIGATPDAYMPALVLASAAAGFVGEASRTAQVGDLVVFHVGAHDPTFTAGSQLDAEIVHVWGPNCINVEVIDADGARHSRTSVRLVPAVEGEPVGHYAILKEAETATG